MKISVITPNFNGARFLETCIRSVVAQRENGFDLEFIVVDGGSSDQSHDILKRWEKYIDLLIIEKDKGPADAINKGFRAASGDWIAWLNADDFYLPSALRRAIATAQEFPSSSFVFGKCIIVDEDGQEIRRGITRFKELFFPISSRFVHQSINYISQPATLIRAAAARAAGPLRPDLKAAFDYEFFLRLWRQGVARRVPGPPLAAFRWHESSISGSQFDRQFREEFEVAKLDAGPWSIQTFLHWFVRWGIVFSYRAMQWHRKRIHARGR